METPEIPGSKFDAMYEGIDLERRAEIELEMIGKEFALRVSCI